MIVRSHLRVSLYSVRGELPVAGWAGDEYLALGRRVGVHVRSPPLLQALGVGAGKVAVRTALLLAPSRAHREAALRCREKFLFSLWRPLVFFFEKKVF